MYHSAHFSQRKPGFHGKSLPEAGSIVGYAAIVDQLQLPMPMVCPVALVCDQNKNYQTKDWIVLPSHYLPENHHNELDEKEALYWQLVFALKYEGVNLMLFHCLTKYYREEQFNN